MVVIAAAVCTNTGRPLVSRQFLEISRSRIEGLLSAFSKLVSTAEERNFIETENVRYVFQPVDALFVVLITNKSSNIMEDLDTLHLFAKLIPEYCEGTSESMVKKNAYELIFAIDEVIVAGHKEKVNLKQIKVLTDMESHEERIHEIIERNKQREAAEQAKLKIKEIEMQKKTTKGGSMAGQGYSSSSYRSEPVVIPQRETQASSRPSSASSGSGRKGMQLGSKTNPSKDHLKALQDLGEIAEEPVPTSRTAAAKESSAPSRPSVQKQGIHVELEEQLHLILNQDGGVEQYEVKGELRVEILDPNSARIKVELEKSGLQKKLQFRTHPNINKPLFNQQNTLALRDASKSFPTNTPLGVLKWRYSGSEDEIPLNVTCWPTPGSDLMTVNLEYELLQKSLQLQDVQIIIPIPDGHSPVIENADGSYEHVPRQSALYWKLPVIDADNSSGSMEFTIPYGGNVSALFPVNVQFSSTTTLSGVTIAAINHVDSNNALPYSSIITFNPEHDGFQVQYC